MQHLTLHAHVHVHVPRLDLARFCVPLCVWRLHARASVYFIYLCVYSCTWRFERETRSLRAFVLVLPTSHLLLPSASCIEADLSGREKIERPSVL